ncbi:hypothetical protein B566_EDAN014281 [Ephemera danica]|nr:hypothetical protein B566_EDAN014281 [Ephemera danica]
MKTFLRVLCLLVLTATSAHAFWGGDDSKYIKKFAMMKVYESCFGDDVVREVREEMRLAAGRCAVAAQVDLQPEAPTTVPPSQHDVPVRPSRPQQSRRPPLASPPTSTHAMSAESLLRLQVLLQGLRQNSGANVAASIPTHQPSFPPQQQQQQIPQHYNPAAYPAPYPAAPAYHHPGVSPNFPPYSPVYYPPMPNPYYPPYNPYAAYTQRSSRDARGLGRARNVTCVMQELGYLDSNLQPNYAGIISRIERLALPVELRKDMVDAVNFCQKFSQCVPDPEEDKLQVSSEFSKPMIFFKCYKQKKLEACVLKDVRERFMSHAAAAGNSADDPEIPDTNNLEDDDTEASEATSSLRFRARSGRQMKSSQAANPSADVAELMFEDALTI